MCILQEQAMLISLSMTHWSGRKYDKSATTKLHESAHAGHDAGRYNKALVAKDAIDAIKKISGKARTEHYRLTLAWNDAGFRLLPTPLYWEYVEAMQGLSTQFSAEVKKFCDSYPTLVEQAFEVLGDLYNPGDYPPVEVVRAKFSFGYTVTPVPDSGDFRVDIENEAMAAIKADLDKRNGNVQQAAMKELWGRLHEAVEAVSKRFTPDPANPDKKVIFRDTLIDNIRDIVDLIPKMNLTNDPEIERMAKVAHDKLATLDTKDLRDFPLDRKKAKAEADQIMGMMSDFMNPA